MSEPKRISPLLDGFTLGTSISEHNGIRCCPAIKENTDQKYIVKIISIPPSQTQIDAMLLAGAYKDPEDVMKYFMGVAKDVQEEAAFLKELSRLEGFTAYEGWQMEPITRKRLGYEVYLVGTYKQSLEKYVQKRPMTHLEAINLSLDLCNALSVCRQAGALYVDLKPSNVFVSDKNDYSIGDLGFVRQNTLSYMTLPEKYISRYTPPELHDPMASINLTVDTYAVGMILYQLYNEGSLPELPQSEEEPIGAPIHADYELAEIILKAIHPDPACRWEDPSQMGQALVAYMQRNVVNNVPITPYFPIDTQAQDVLLPKDPEPEEEPDIPQTEPAANTPETDEIPDEPSQEEPDQAETVQEEPEQAFPESAEESGQDPLPMQNIPQTQEDIPADDDAEELAPAITEKSAPRAASSDELSRIIAKANDLIAHETPEGVILPQIPDPPDPFAFATEDSIEAADLNTPFDPVMDQTVEERNLPSSKKIRRKFLSTERKQKIKKFFITVAELALLACICLAGFWFYRNVYMQEIQSISIEGGRNRVVVSIETDADESQLLISCSDNYGNVHEGTVTNGQAVFTDLLPNTMYTVQLDIDGFHALMGQTSEIFTTDTTTSIVSFTASAGPEDGSVVLNFTADGDEPEIWNLTYHTNGAEPKTMKIEGHSATITGLSLGKAYTFVLDAGTELSLSGNTTLTFMPTRLILAENLVATTSNGSDMTIRWNAPGDTIVEFWNVRCYNDSGYDHTLTVTETEAYLSNIDPTVSYHIEVTACGMTQPARTSITANPINITALHVDESETDQLTVTWDYVGAEPSGGWLLLYSIDDNADMNVIKCNNASAVISPKIPEADYHFTIQAVDGTSVFDNMQMYTCSKAGDFNANGIAKTNITVNLLKTPDTPNWRFDSIGSDAFTTEFALGDPISLVLHGSTDFYLPGTNIKVLYVIRDAHGNVIPKYVSEVDENWRRIWNGGDYHYGELDLPVVPQVAGSYQLNVYIDGMSVAQLNFTVR